MGDNDSTQAPADTGEAGRMQRSRPTNSIRQQHPSTSNTSRTNSGAAPSTTTTHSTSYASARAPSTATTSQSSLHTRTPAQLPHPPPPPPAGTTPQPARGYENVTSIEPAPKRPLWSLGSTLPRVRRLPAAKPTKTAHPTPGSRSNIVQQPVSLVPLHTPRSYTGNRAPTESTAGAPEAPVHEHDFAARTTLGPTYNVQGTTDADVERQELSISPTTSASTTNAGAGDLTPIREGETLPTGQAHGSEAEQFSVMHARPRFDYSFSSPTAADTANVRFVGNNELGKLSSDTQTDLGHHLDSDPQQRLATARQQLVEEAQHGDGLLATQGSAIEEHDEVEDDKEPASRHIKTSSMPFLPSQGFEVLVSEPHHHNHRHHGTDQLERDKSRTESLSRSAMDKTRHPGLSGARPTPRGRAAGGPAAGVGTRKPSSTRRASNAAKNEAGYFDDDAAAGEFAHLQRVGSSSTRQPARQSQEEKNHIEARPVGGRSGGSDKARDTRSAWLARTMPSHASRAGEEADAKRTSRESESAGQPSLHQARDAGHAGRYSDETAYSSYSADAHDGASQGDSAQDEEEEEIWLGGQGTLSDGSIAFPTLWSRWRYHSREFLAELLATTLLITVGTAVDCQVALSQSMGPSAGAYSNQNWAWGIAVASTIYLSGGRSGAHCNPAITMALAVFRGFPWIQVPVYWAAQLLGSILGAAITYGIYLPAIDQYEGGRNIRTLAGEHGTGRLFVTVPQLVFTAASGFSTEVVATSILMAMVLAVGDETNAPPSDGLSALVLGLVVVMIGMSFGWPTSYAISPSRDLGPRLFLYMAGYGRELWTHNAYWWLYGPQAGCFAGALLGALLYDLAIFTGEESPINYTRQGWMQSTPAQIGARLRNSADRAHFLKRSLGGGSKERSEQGDWTVREDRGAVQVTGRSN
ncbi:hypothetical protein EX895_005795 [Sporisorium graminicola]|uniref:Aquaporin n=1 Tax=Sporisorium graminicola TaxID=280036 RepID=A0A4U7KKM8_9BASI|nr:hypothetical protein EX895_005795 [Sporisorium graminicola]TKY84715.1 hypothetical protein EX895_005795 [Sporisorium graminicola]